MTDTVTTLILAAACGAGAFLQSLTDKDCATFSRAALRQTALGFIMGGLWQVKIGTVWPVVDFGQQSLVVNAFLSALFGFAAAHVIAERVIGWIRGLAGSKPNGP